MVSYSRRDFLKSGLAAAALAGAKNLPLRAATQKATDWVTLGKSGIKVTRLALGTGTFGGRVQHELGQEQFTRLVRYAYDSGVRFFETAESYGESPQMLGTALKGIPRDSYRLMNKITTHGDVDPLQRIDEMRRASQTDYFDILLLHWQHTSTWPEESKRWKDGISEAHAKQAVLGYGCSVHGLPALRQCPRDKWIQVALVRMNHQGVRMDAEDFETAGLGDVSEVATRVKQTREQGTGVIGMKLVGEGRFTSRADRQAAMKFAFQRAGTACVTVGYKSPAEVDEAIENVNLALA